MTAKTKLFNLILRLYDKEQRMPTRRCLTNSLNISKKSIDNRLRDLAEDGQVRIDRDFNITGIPSREKYWLRLPIRCAA